MNADRWIRRFGPEHPTAPRLLLLPHAGGSASYFHGLARELTADFDVLCAQYPGRQDRRHEPPLRTIAGLADGIFAALGVPDRPTILFGHSMGAVLAFEVGLRLEAAGATHLRGVVLSGRRAPTVPGPDDVHLRDDDGLVREIRELSGTAGDVLRDRELMKLILPGLRADYQAVETYRMRVGACLRTPVSVLVGDADPRVRVADAHAWSALTTGGATLRVFPGGHFYLDDRRGEVAEAIRDSADAFSAHASA
ncbi:thioesterase II family protein [Micromonospora sp. NPDC048898]|uniref:thioesterase II family protein n=1 Tax=Micromonospora sp. NPDC048898 TaxID=3364260 RepID=UPI003720A31D